MWHGISSATQLQENMQNKWRLCSKSVKLFYLILWLNKWQQHKDMHRAGPQMF